MTDTYTVKHIAAIALERIDGLIDKACRALCLDEERCDRLLVVQAYTEAKVAVLEAALFRFPEAPCLLSCEEHHAPDTTVCRDAPENGETPVVAVPKRRAERVSGDDILDYLWQHEGSTRFEYILRDLYDSHVKDGRVSNLNKALKRLEMLGDVHLDREDGKIVVATARRMPREA